jgi:hypothetical protein
MKDETGALCCRPLDHPGIFFSIKLHVLHTKKILQRDKNTILYTEKPAALQ